MLLDDGAGRRREGPIGFRELTMIDAVAVAARYATDTLDLFVQEDESMAANDPHLETRITAHPLMQQELRRQARDRADVASNGGGAAAIFGRRSREAALVLAPAPGDR